MDKVIYKNISAFEWNEYICQLDTSTFNYTSERIDFDLSISDYIIENESYILLEGKDVIACVIIYIEKYENQNWISFNKGFCMAPIMSSNIKYSNQEKLIKSILEDIESIAKCHDCIGIKLKMDPLSNPCFDNFFMNYNYLLEYGYADATIGSRVIDLRKENECLLSEFRNNHKRAVKKAKEIISIEIYNASTITSELFEKYKEIYLDAAGRETASYKNCHHFFQWIVNGKGILVFAKNKQEYLSTAVFTIFKNQGYYASGAELRERSVKIPLGHYLHYEVMIWMKYNNIEFYETGWQQYYDSNFGTVSEKEKNISLFKKGFGGYTVPMFCGIKSIGRITL